jgi:hypothetical protein
MNRGGHLSNSRTAIVHNQAAAVRFSIECKNLRAGADAQA